MSEILIAYCGCALAGKTSNLEILARKITQFNGQPTVSWCHDFVIEKGWGALALQTQLRYEQKVIDVKIVSFPNFCYMAADTIEKVKQIRKAIIAKAHGVVFVVDTQTHKIEESLGEWHALLGMNGMHTMPTILQYNKRDMPKIVIVAEVSKLFNQSQKYTEYKAIAAHGIGVLETFGGILALIPHTSDIASHWSAVYQCKLSSNIQQDFRQQCIKCFSEDEKGCLLFVGLQIAIGCFCFFLPYPKEISLLIGAAICLLLFFWLSQKL